MGAHPQLLHHLPVLGERAGFVGTDHRDRTETLHRRQPPDQGSAAHHALGADGEGHRDHRRQALRHDRHCHGERHLQQVEQGLTQEPAQQHHHGHQPQGSAHKGLGQAIEPLLQGCAFPAGRVEHGRDLAQLGVHASGAHHGYASAAHHFRALKHAIEPLQHWCAGLQHQFGLLEHRCRFSGERRFLHAEIGHLQEASIGSDPVTGFDPDQITRHKLLAGQPLPEPIPAHLHQGLRQVAQRQQGLLRLAFLQIAQQGVEQHDHQDRDRILWKGLLMQSCGA